MIDDKKGRGKRRSWMERLSYRLMRSPQNRAELMDVLRDAKEHGIVSGDILSMIESVLQVSEMHVRDVMVPKSQMVVVSQTMDLDHLLPIVIESGHSRFPVVNEESDDVIGILLAKYLLKSSIVVLAFTV